MRASIQKWGNSLGVRIPSALSKQLHLSTGNAVDITVKDGLLVIKPRRYNLKDMLKDINPDDYHEALLDDAPRGKEW